MGTYKDGLFRFYGDDDIFDKMTIVQTTLFSAGNPNLSVGCFEFYGSIDRVRMYPVGLDPDNLELFEW